jgi:hypothetical protein
MLVRPDLQTMGLRAVRQRLDTTDAVPHSYIVHTIRAFSVVQSLGELPQVVLHRFSEISAMENSVRGILPLASFAQPTRSIRDGLLSADDRNYARLELRKAAGGPIGPTVGSDGCGWPELRGRPEDMLGSVTGASEPGGAAAMVRLTTDCVNR